MSRRKQNNQIKSENRLKAIWRGSIIIILIASVGIVTTYIFSTGYHNSGKIVIKPDEATYFGLHFMNSVKGELIQEGIAHFKRDIYNNGLIDCGQCVSGATYFSSQKGRPQFIKGSEKVRFYDVILDNPNNLYLKGELQIVNSFRFQNGAVYTNGMDDSQFLHFLENSIDIDASHLKHVIGNVGKTGNEDFIFPIGNGRRLKKLGMSDLEINGTVKVSYVSFFQNVNNKEGSQNIRFKTRPLGKHISAICSEGYWTVKGENQLSLSIFWDISFGLSTKLDSIQQLALVGWNGKEWVNVGIEKAIGDMKAGSLISQRINPNDMQAYTLAVRQINSKKLKKGKDKTVLNQFSNQDSLGVEKFIVSPNPAHEMVSIFVEWPSINQINVLIENDKQLQFYKKEMSSYGNLTYDISEWPSGYYWVNLKNQSNILTSQKLMIQ